MGKGATPLEELGGVAAEVVMMVMMVVLMVVLKVVLSIDDGLSVRVLCVCVREAPQQD